MAEIKEIYPAMILKPPHSLFNDSSSIPEVFSQKTVFITGANGFLGKVLVEKLLYSCSDIKEIIILLKGTAKLSCEEKFSKLMSNSVFDRIKRENPELLDKVTYVKGDVVSDMFGLCSEDLDRVTRESSFVFHCAANVRFEDDPRNSLRVNLLGVKNLLCVCYEMKQVKAIVHVSTAYSFCEFPITDELVHHESFSPLALLEAIEFMNDNQLRNLCQRVLLETRKPSLYHFSKGMAEYLISLCKGQLPICVVRPSIVTAAAKEPFPGWIDNLNGPSGFLAMSLKGVLNTLLVKKSVNADWVPVDIAVNTLIASAYYTAEIRKHQPPGSERSDIVVNCVCPMKNLITWSEAVDIIIPLLDKYPSMTAIKPLGGVVTGCPRLYFLVKMFSHYLPAFIVDLLLFPIKRRMLYVTYYSRIHKVMGHMALYTTHNFSFSSRHMQFISSIMKEKDKETFNIDQSKLSWREYLEDYTHGIRTFFLEEGDDSLPAARKRLLRLKIVWTLAKVLPVVTICGLLIKKNLKL